MAKKNNTLVSPDRVWTVKVRRQQDGEVTVQECDLNLPDDPTFEQIQAAAEQWAARRAQRDRHGVDWLPADVTIEEVSWS